ncbi:MAG: AraC family transcriptional regulator [Pseudomonadota bacterium]
MNFIKSQHFSQLFTGHQGLIVFVKDLESTLVNCNQALAEHLGFSDVRSIIGKNDFDLFPHEYANQYRADDSKVMGSKKPKLNIVELFPTPAGEMQWVVCNKVPIIENDGKVLGLCGALQKLEDAPIVIEPYKEIFVALAHIRDHYTDKISNEELANMVGLSVRQFEKRFKLLFHISAHQYILRLRILRSCDMIIARELSLSDIAMTLGFYDQSAFTAKFKQIMGVTPLKYASLHRA